MATMSCPHCGAPVDSGRSTCPNCRMALRKKSSLTPFLIVGGIIVVFILVIAVLLLMPVQQSGGIPDPKVPASPTVIVEKAPSPPCTIAITGRKNPPSSIQLQVMTSTCYAGDISELLVSVNGEQKGKLGTSPGASGTYNGITGSNNVIVTAKFANGAEQVVYQNAAL